MNVERLDPMLNSQTLWEIRHIDLGLAIVKGEEVFQSRVELIPHLQFEDGSTRLATEHERKPIIATNNVPAEEVLCRDNSSAYRMESDSRVVGLAVIDAIMRQRR